MLVADVMKDGPAEAAGHASRATSSSSSAARRSRRCTDLQKRVAAIEPGRAAAAHGDARQQDRHRLTVKIGEQPARGDGGGGRAAATRASGLTVEPLTRGDGRSASASPPAAGVLVTEVAAGQRGRGGRHPARRRHPRGEPPPGRQRRRASSESMAAVQAGRGRARVHPAGRGRQRVRRAQGRRATSPERRVRRARSRARLPAAGPSCSSSTTSRACASRCASSSRTSSRCSRRDDGAAALEILRARRVDVALLDVRMPGEPGPTVLPRSWPSTSPSPVILMTAVRTCARRWRPSRRGAYDYITKPFDVDEILTLVRAGGPAAGLEREVRYLRAELDRAHGFDAAGRPPPAMVRLYELIAQVAQTHATVLDHRGERHRQGAGGARHPPPEPAARPALRGRQLAAIPDTLLESELFGHEKGAFTGAHARKLGQVRAGPRRHALPRRDRQPARRPPGQAAARAPGARDRAARRHPHHPGGRARHRRHQRGPARRPSGPAPSARISTTGSTWCRSAIPPLRERKERHPAPGRALRPQVLAGVQEGRPRHLARARCRRWPATTGRATCASSRTSSSAAWRWPRAR